LTGGQYEPSAFDAFPRRGDDRMVGLQVDAEQPGAFHDGGGIVMIICWR